MRAAVKIFEIKRFVPPQVTRGHREVQQMTGEYVALEGYGQYMANRIGPTSVVAGPD